MGKAIPNPLKIRAGVFHFHATRIGQYLYTGMRYIVANLGLLSLVMGQAPGLAWVELADTVYGIENAQDTFVIYIQSRSGNVRRFDRYERDGGGLYLASYDSVYLDASGRVSRIRFYERPNSSAPFSLVAQQQFRYPGTPAIKVEVTDGVSSTVDAEGLYYGLTIFEESLVWDILSSSIPVEAYPRGYRTGHYGDSILLRSFSDDQAFGSVRRPRAGACDTFIFYFGPANGPLNPIPLGKICHTGGRIDSVISPSSQIYWSYNTSNRPVQRFDTAGSDTTRYNYTYDASGRLIQSKESGVSSNGPYVRTYILRYRGTPASLASELAQGCLTWDVVHRRGMLTCKAQDMLTGLQLYDLHGRVVWEGRVQGSDVFEIPAGIPAGLYYLRAGEGVVRLYLLP